MVQIRVADSVPHGYWYKSLAGKLLMAAEKSVMGGGSLVYYTVRGYESGTIIYADDCVEVPLQVERLVTTHQLIGS